MGKGLHDAHTVVSVLLSGETSNVTKPLKLRGHQNSSEEWGWPVPYTCSVLEDIQCNEVRFIRRKVCAMI
eukprot:1157787-Pelagomonas_calceolata.AAC.7